MHLEIRKRGKKRLFYLACSFRDNGKVRKTRKYLGSDLDDKRVKKLRESAEKAILEQVKIYMRINNPLHTVLTPKEMDAIKTLITKGDIKIKHLTSGEWQIFTEIFTYDTNAIEGSAVTAQEVKNIIGKDSWPRERTKWEISETYGVADAVKYIRKTSVHVSLVLIRKLHEIVFKNSKVFAGKFREDGLEVAVIDRQGKVLHRGAPQRKITSLLKELEKWYGENKNKYHPIVLGAVVHNQFENIHPFQDGNGRVGRLLLNNILLKNNMPPINIELENRKDYYSALQEYQKQGNLRPTIELILKEYEELRKSLKSV